MCSFAEVLLTLTNFFLVWFQMLKVQRIRLSKTLIFPTKKNDLPKCFGIIYSLLFVTTIVIHFSNSYHIDEKRLLKNRIHHYIWWSTIIISFMSGLLLLSLSTARKIYEIRFQQKITVSSSLPENIYWSYTQTHTHRHTRAYEYAAYTHISLSSSSQHNFRLQPKLNPSPILL